MAKAGRPKAEITKEKVISYRTTEAEYKRLKEYSDKEGITVSEALQRGIKKLLNTP